MFDEDSSSEEEDSISGSGREDAHDEEEKQDEEEEDEAPLIHSLRSSSKLRSMKLSKDENKSHRRTGASASRTSGMKGIYFLLDAAWFLRSYIVQSSNVLCILQL